MYAMPLCCRKPFIETRFPTTTDLLQKKVKWFPAVSAKTGRSRLVIVVNANENNFSLGCRKIKEQPGKKEHHLWMKRDSAGSGQKALNLVRIVSKLPNEKEAIYGALDKWTAWETEFPLIAAAKALGILRKRNQWLRIIQVGWKLTSLKQTEVTELRQLSQLELNVCVSGNQVSSLEEFQVTKWMLSKGQGKTMGTYDTLLLAFDMDGRVDEAESIWNMILQTHTRSVSKRVFSRMISLYDHHHMPEKILEVFADMEELGVKPDEDTVRRVARAFKKLGQEDKQKQVFKKYDSKWKYLYFNGERVRVRTTSAWDE